MERRVAQELCVCRHAYATVCTSNWSKAAASKVHMPRCQQLGSRGSYWADWVFDPNSWRNPPCTYTCIIFSLVNLCPAQAEMGTGWGHLVLCLCGCSKCGQPCIHAVCMYTLCACACREYIFSLAAVGPGAMEQQQPQLSQAAGSSMIL